MTPAVFTQALALAEVADLRRYAFCLTGNRTLGDLVILTALEAVDVTRSSRIDLYRKVNECAREGASRSKVLANVSNGFHAQVLSLPLPQRQIVTLYAVIGLPCAEVAAIMGLSEELVRQLYADSVHTLREKPMHVLIIEDEAIIAHELCQIVKQLGFSIAGLAKNKTEALRIASLAKPSLILADYQLKGETGLDAVRAIREKMNASVIYVTAYPDLVATLRDEARDIVIPKPFTFRSVERAVQKQMHMAA